MAVLCGILLLFLCLTTVSISAQNPVICEYLEQRRVTTCRDGIWPTSTGGQNPNITADTVELVISNVSFRKNDVAAIPALSLLQKLRIADSNWQSGEHSMKMPFAILISNVNRSTLEELRIVNSRYDSIDKYEFVDFTSLRVFEMRNSTLSSFHPKAFGDTVDDQCGNLPGVLELSLVGNQRMSSFVWEALQPLSCRLKSLAVQDDQDLTDVMYDGTPMALKKLETVDFSGNGKLKPLAKTVLDTIHDRESPFDTVIWSHHFRCDSCDQEFFEPLVNWTRGGRNASSRFLRLTCNIDNEIQSNEIQGGTAFWNYFGGQICRVAPGVTAPSTLQTTISTASPPRSTTSDCSQPITVGLSVASLSLVLLLINSKSLSVRHFPR